MNVLFAMEGRKGDAKALARKILYAPPPPPVTIPVSIRDPSSGKFLGVSACGKQLELQSDFFQWTMEMRENLKYLSFNGQYVQSGTLRLGGKRNALLFQDGHILALWSQCFLSIGKHEKLEWSRASYRWKVQ